MKRQVNITVTGVHQDADGREETTQQDVQGEYFERNGCRYLLYQEPDADRRSAAKNTVKITETTVELIRKGAVSSHMVFETGKTHRTTYVTPYGTLLLTVATEDMSLFWDDAHGEIHISYSLSEKGALLSRCRLTIKVFS